MNNKKLTIITINYNNNDGLLKTFESIKNQTWLDFEYIVIDGGSTDGGKELIENNTQINYSMFKNDYEKYLSYISIFSNKYIKKLVEIKNGSKYKWIIIKNTVKILSLFSGNNKK